MQTLKKLYNISSHSGDEKRIRKYVKKQCEKRGALCWVDTCGNLYAVKGDAETYPCVVSHLDEVHGNRSAGYRVIQSGDTIFGYDVETMETCGIGADDKNGIWVCLQALERYDVMKCAFFVSEEVGCIGSSHADMTFFDDARFVLQCDRRGGSDFITNAAGVDLCTESFVNDAMIDWFGYSKANGSVTDVMELKERGLKVCACNISCGYYNPHTDSEATKVSELRNCLDLVCNIIDNCKDVYPHEYERKVFSYNSYYGNYNPYRHDDWYHHNGNDTIWFDDGKKDSDNLWYDNDGYNEQLDMLYELMEEGMTNSSFDEYGLDLFYEAEKDNFPALTKEDYHNAYEDIKQWYGAYVTED